MQNDWNRGKWSREATQESIYKSKQMLQMNLAFSYWNMGILEKVKELSNKRESNMPIKRGI